MIKFSIITITYNAAAVFMRTAESVLKQNYGNVEHIIIDGASTDATIELAHNYKKLSNNSSNGHSVIIKSEPDKGLYDAMNKGLAVASGQYVCFMNAGDFYPNNSVLSDISKSVENNSQEQLPAVIYGDTDIVDNDGNYLGHRHLSAPDVLSWKSFMHGMLVCHQAFYARTDIAKDITYNLKYRHSADVDWCIRVMKVAEREHLTLKNVHKVVAYYQREGQTTQYHKASLLERFYIMRHHYGIFRTLCSHLWFFVRAILRKLHVNIRN
ncbi:MAG: glycosyltransferase family 2 protein [Prevotella sp.]